MPTSSKVLKSSNPFEKRKPGEPFAVAKKKIHKTGKLHHCETDSRGYATPDNKDSKELVLDASQGFVPLWAKNQTLFYSFNEVSLGYFQDPEQAKQGIKELFEEALLAWGDASPIKFKHRDDAYDFEILMRNSDACQNGGCVLASAFFPDGGRHILDIYPKMFSQVRKEQVDTLIHEIGHIFGLRHFFAKISETAWASENFGTQWKFTIMTYGEESELTPLDKTDLKTLYQKVWKGEITDINGTPIRLFKTYNASGVQI